MNIYLLRHGQTEDNATGRFAGGGEARLTGFGRQQLRTAAQKLHQAGIGSVWSSPSPRALESASLVLPDVPARQDPRLRERDMGIFEGLTYLEIRQRHLEACSAWDADWMGYAIPGGESYLQFYERVSGFWIDLLRQEPEDVLLSTHGGVFRAICCLVMDNPALFWRFSCGNGDLALIRHEAGTSYLQALWPAQEPGSSEGPAAGTSAGNQTERGDKVMLETTQHPKAVVSRIVLVTGGSRSGKSTFSEKLLADENDVLYIATATRSDGEMAARIARHRERRNPHWTTHEGFSGLDVVVRGSPHAHILLDCCTLWFTNLLFSDAGVSLDGDNITPEKQDQAMALLRGQFQSLADAVRETGKTLVLVTNEVGWSLVSEYPLGRLFSDLTGWMNQRMAEQADEVHLVVCGQALRLK